MSLKLQAVNSLKWLIGSSFISRLIFTGTTVVLARLLNPAIFGLYALAFVAIDALTLFKSMGFDSALIRRKSEVDEACDTAFFIIPLLGILLFAILFIGAPFVSSFFNNPKLINILRVLGVVFVFSCFAKVPNALLEKRMQFAKVSVVSIISIIIYSASAITFALLNFGVWSLVYAYILRSFTNLIMAWYFAKWRPKGRFNKRVAWEMFHFGKYLFLGAVIYFLRANLDKVFVGKVLGLSMLGLYVISFSFAHFCRAIVGTKVYRVFFPAFSKIQDDTVKLKTAFLKVFKYLGLIAIPFGVFLSTLSYELLRFIYGEKWLGAVSIVRVLAFAGIFTTLQSSIGPIFLAKGKPQLGFYRDIIQVGIFFLFFIPAAKTFGMIGIAYIIVIGSVVAFSLSLLWVKNLLSLKFSSLMAALKIPLLGSLCMGLGVIIMKNIFLTFNAVNKLNFYLTSVSLFISAVIFYILMLLWTEKRILRNFGRLIFNK